MTAPAAYSKSQAASAAEYRDIHLTVCRYRRQGLICSTCSDLTERAERLADLKRYHEQRAAERTGR